MCGFFKRNCLGLQKFLPLIQSPLVFAARSCEDFLALERWAGGTGVGLGLLSPVISLPNYYVSHVGEEPACSTSAPLLPVSMDVVSFIP